MQVVEKVQLLRQPANGDEAGGWLAQVGPAVIPVAGFDVSSGDSDGVALVSLLVPAAAVVIDRTAASPVQAAAAKRAANRLNRGVFGAPGTPDPRAGIPGWEPEPALAEQAAADAEPTA